MKKHISLLIILFFYNICYADNNSYLIRVLVVNYFPIKGKKIDINVTGDWNKSLKQTRKKTAELTSQVIEALEQGSKYHGYKNKQAQPSLKYKIVKRIEFLEPLPTFKKKAHRAPMTDYYTIMERIGIQYWVEKQGIKEVWLWGYHGEVLDLWESNMSGPYGDISNSDRDPNDLPLLKKTYTVYHYNYQRGLSEAVENHMHQIEAVLNHIDGRDITPIEEWNKLLFWGQFVGSDHTHKIINPGCGWSHYPPNAKHDYDWANHDYVLTDMEEWHPDDTGQKKKINCEQWNCDSLSWFIYWMQNIPGNKNRLTYKGKKLTNWWMFIGDFDYAMKNKIKLY